MRFSGTGLRFSGDGLALAETPAWDVPLSELQPPAGYSWNDVFVAIGEYEDVPPQNVTLGQLLDVLDTLNYVPPAVAPPVINALSTMSLLDLDPTGNVLRNVSLVGLLLGNTRLVDIPLPAGSDWCTIIDPEFTGTCATTDIGDATVLDLNLAGLRSDNLPLDGIPLADISLDPESVLAGLLANAPTFDSNNDGVVNGNDFDDGLYVPAQAGDTLASYLVRGIDALNVPWEQLPLSTTFDVRQFALGAPVTFTSSWSQVGTGRTDVVVTAPTTGFVLAQGSPTCTTTAGTCNVTQTGTTFRVQPSGSGFQTVNLRVAYRPSGLVGAGALTSGSFSVKAGSAGVQSFTVGVTDPWSASTPPSLDPDVLYFGTADRGEIDTYDVDVSDYAPGSHVAVRLSNLTDDADLVLYRDAGTSLRFSGTGMRFSGTGLRYSGTGLRYSGGSGDESVENRASRKPWRTSRSTRRCWSRTCRRLGPRRPKLQRPSPTPTRASSRSRSAASTRRPPTTSFASPSPPSAARTARPRARPSPVPAWRSAATPAADTIVVYPRERFGADAGTIDAAIADLNAFWPGIQVATVSTSGPDWTQVDGACSVYAANAVAEDVAAALQAEAADGTVKHVMLIGGDDKLPMYRSPDTTLIANEANYASTIGGQNPLVSALETQNLLTDDIYGDDDPWPFLNRLYFTPDRAVGRLVESTADIDGQIRPVHRRRRRDEQSDRNRPVVHRRLRLPLRRCHRDQPESGRSQHRSIEPHLGIVGCVGVERRTEWCGQRCEPQDRLDPGAHGSRSVVVSCR